MGRFLETPRNITLLGSKNYKTNHSSWRSERGKIMLVPVWAWDEKIFLKQQQQPPLWGLGGGVPYVVFFYVKNV